MREVNRKYINCKGAGGLGIYGSGAVSMRRANVYVCRGMG